MALDDLQRFHLQDAARRLRYCLSCALYGPFLAEKAQRAIFNVVAVFDPGRLGADAGPHAIAIAAYGVMRKPCPLVSSWEGLAAEVLEFVDKALAAPVDPLTQRAAAPPPYPRVRRYERDGAELEAGPAHLYPVRTLFRLEPDLERVAVVEHDVWSCTIVTVGFPLDRRVVAEADGVVMPGHRVEYSHRGVLLDGVPDA